ncbi:hypothetical protein Hypma_003687 [Hypsizygus marmoreus]|uniref:Uncharacterized protein n=1 Tax=Hypsizygus marmoreus TaxID=39966 RepID=A0A369J1F8_HYPMA|nr:hypothetical protein Hypma_003687 [Hypsizygus marmoreus]
MPLASCSPSDSDNAHGIPARTPASTALWAHLLRKDTLGPPPNSGIIIPPITPLDKNGTSMRILLHDTQANFESFSARVDKLCSGVDEAKREIAMVNTVFQRQNDTLTEEMVDLVNRAQTEIQKTLGAPAQAGCVQQLSKNLDHRLDTLDKRMDAIQLFHQTHSQTLQLQSQALQSLQDQQGTIVMALMPLLPLLQAIPLHIESAKNSITDTFKKSSRSHTTPSSLGYRVNQHPRKRTSSTLRSDQGSPSPLSNKRPRVGAQPKDIVQFSGTGDDVCESVTHPGGKRRAPNSPDVLSSRRLSSHSATMEYDTSNRSKSNHDVENIDPDSKDEGIGHEVTSRASVFPSHTRTRPSTPVVIGGVSHPLPLMDLSSPPFSGITLSAKRPPRLLRLHSTASQIASHTSPISSIAGSSTLGQLAPLLPPSRTSDNSSPTPVSRKHPPILSGRHDPPLDLQQEISHLSLSVRESTSSIISPRQHKIPPTPDVTKPRLPRNDFHSTKHLSHTPLTISKPGPSVPRPLCRVPLTPIVLPKPIVCSPIAPPPTQPRQLRSSRSITQPPPPPPYQAKTAVQNNVPTISFVPAAQARGRRSPFREGRRFIPLSDSDDEDEIEVDRGG